jgi:RNA polymerase sigma factor (sigma-70 family)
MHFDLRDSAAATVAAAAGGDQAAWNRLVERHSSLVWGVARAHRLSGSDAADVVQTTWLRLIEHLPQIRNPDGVGAWLATTARRESLRALRHARRCEPTEQVEAVAEVAGLDARLLRDERDAAVARAFARLPARDRALLRLLTLDPALSYEEIGAALSMPIGSIGPTRGRALERLRRELRAAGALEQSRE